MMSMILYQEGSVGRHFLIMPLLKLFGVRLQTIRW